MKNLKQGLFLSITLLAGCASTEVKQAAPKIPSMNDAQLKTLLVGKTMIGRSKGNDWTTKVNADGTVVGTYGPDSPDTGKYKIENGKYCSQWKTWANGNKRCWSISKRAEGYYGKPVSGGGDPFKFTVK